MSPVMGSEKTMAISTVCTMGTPECDEELSLFLHCLRTHHPNLPVVVGCTSAMLKLGDGAISKAYANFHDDERVEWVPCLDPYTPINRSEMEQQRGVWYPSRHTDFMMEKANLMEYAMMHQKQCGGDNTTAVAFLDCDVVLLDELPCLPLGTEVALSPHRICRHDEALFGRYNGGFVVATNPLVLHKWRRATQHSRFFDQASLESVAREFSSALHEFPPQHNYGYWRFFQSYRQNPILEAKQFSVECLGERRERVLCYEGIPLSSIHTHFFAPVNSQTRSISVFNGLMKKWILKCVSSSPSAVRTAVWKCGLAAATENSRYKKCFGSFLSLDMN